MSPRRLAAVAASLSLLIAGCSSPGPRATEPTPSATRTKTKDPTPTPTKTRTPTPDPTPALPRPDTAAKLTRRPCGSPSADRTVTFRIAVDAGLRTTARAFGGIVRGIICDERSWIGSGEVRFLYDPRGTMLIGLRTPDNAERRCYALIRLSVNRFYSCGTPQEVVINADRWFKNSPYWPGPLGEYRRMLTNHEVGHGLLLHHSECPSDGAPAPVMMQQSKGMNLNGFNCEPNPWPLPRELRLLR